MADRAWDQFRRLILGTVLELLLEERVPVDFTSIEVRFDEALSSFHVPRLNNYMRFVGGLEGRLSAPTAPELGARVRTRLLDAWPELLACVKIPIGDRLDLTRNDIQVSIVGERIVIRFDLEAD
jgi:hypothetical protein